MGIPLGAPYKFKAIWDCVLERFEGRLAGWKLVQKEKSSPRQILLYRARTYLQSTLPLEASILKKLDNIMNFLLEGIDEEFKYHLMAGRKFVNL